MSFKAKDLHYDAAQPAFLRRMRGEMAGDDSARHEQPMLRNKRPKQDEEDDAPIYVLEDTNQSLSKAEYEALVAEPQGKETATDETKDPKKETAENGKDNIAEGSKTSKKRKVAKVIGEEQAGDDAARSSEMKVTKKPKKKAKPVKLSFAQEEG